MLSVPWCYGKVPAFRKLGTAQITNEPAVLDDVAFVTSGTQTEQDTRREIVVKSSGRLTGIASSAAATVGHDSGSVKKPVDWLVISVTSSSKNVISPAESTGPPPAQATCSERRGASKRVLLTSTVKVAIREPFGSVSDERIAIHAERSSTEQIGVPAGEEASAESQMSAGPTY